jgi:hypothetical protein
MDVPLTFCLQNMTRRLRALDVDAHPYIGLSDIFNQAGFLCAAYSEGHYVQLEGLQSFWNKSGLAQSVGMYPDKVVWR